MHAVKSVAPTNANAHAVMILMCVPRPSILSATARCFMACPGLRGVFRRLSPRRLEDWPIRQNVATRDELAGVVVSGKDVRAPRWTLRW
jgi:hypothetical protein